MYNRAAARPRLVQVQKRRTGSSKEKMIMKEFQYTVKDACGIHARPAGLLVKTVKGFASSATLENGRQELRYAQADGSDGHGRQAG